jgi:hypothetical protein
LEYITRTEAIVTDKNNTPIIFKNNINGTSLLELETSFIANEANRKPRKGMVYIYHDILAFSPLDKEKLNLKILEDLGMRYLQLRSEFSPAVFTAHQDTDSPHLHFLIGPESITGKSARVSKAKLETIKISLQEYQIEKYADLVSVVEHGKHSKDYVKNQEFRMSERTGRPSNKDIIKEKLSEAFAVSLSESEFYENIKEQGLNVYERGGKITGIEDDDRKYRFSTLGYTNEKFQELSQTSERLDLLNEISMDQEIDIETNEDISILYQAETLQENELDLEQ